MPPGGTKVDSGAKVRVLVSVGQPQVLYTNGKDVLRLNGATGAKLDPVATGPDDERTRPGPRTASTSPTRPTAGDAQGHHEEELGAGTGDARGRALLPDLAWAPTADVNVIAMRDDRRRPRLGPLPGQRRRATRPRSRCLHEPSFKALRALHWAQDGRSIIGLGVKMGDESGRFGIVRWRVKSGKPAFSADTADWTKGRFLTDTDTPGKGVLDAEVSPDGKRLALVSNVGSNAFQLWLADDPEDFALSSAKRTQVRTCKVSWRGDSKELLTVQGDALCEEDVSVVQGGSQRSTESEGAQRLGRRPVVPAVDRETGVRGACCAPAAVDSSIEERATAAAAARR